MKKPDEGQTTKTIKGKEVKWCAKCKNINIGWTTSHFTDGHTSKPATASQTKSEKSDNNMKLELNDELKSAMMTLNMDTNSLGLNKWAWGSCGVR